MAAGVASTLWTVGDLIDMCNGYIESLQAAIKQLHRCDAEYLESVSVHEIFNGQTVWNGTVEVFSLANHPKAKRCFAWSHKEGD